VGGSHGPFQEIFQVSTLRDSEDHCKSQYNRLHAQNWDEAAQKYKSDENVKVNDEFSTRNLGLEYIAIYEALCTLSSASRTTSVIHENKVCYHAKHGDVPSILFRNKHP
jgi:hypothetical protein